jgi:large subunit ribosomal protein L18
MHRKKETRLRRARKLRFKIRELGVHRLTINRSNQHIYAQVLLSDGSQTIASASTAETEIASGLKSTSNKEAAEKVGRIVAERALAAGVTTVAFDRAGFQYHGRIAVLADAARNAGLEF